MTTLASALRAVSEGTSIHQVPSRLTKVIHALENDRTIHPQMRNDLLTLITNTTNLAESATDDSYPVDIVTDTVAALLTVSSAILAHVTHNRPSFYAYGIEDRKTRTLLDSIYPTRAEALREINNLKNLGATSRLRVVPIRISSQIVNRPDLVQIPMITITSEPPNVPSDYQPIPNILEGNSREPTNRSQIVEPNTDLNPSFEPATDTGGPGGFKLKSNPTT